MIGLLLIGDELLSAQTKDENLAYMLNKLSLTGHRVSEVRIIGDKLEDISTAISSLSQKHHYVITSGGVGPTHDDCTILALAKAFHEDLFRHPILESRLRDFYKQNITKSALKMADVPKSTILLDKENSHWPIISVHNCYALPGVPKIFKKKFNTLVPLLPKGNSYVTASIFVTSDEAFFAEKLLQICKKEPQVIIGSYPIFNKKKFSVHIVLKHRSKSILKPILKKLEAFFKKQGTLSQITAIKSFSPKEKI